MINGVVGVAIWTDNMDEMLAFYKETLSLTPHSERPNFVSFKWGAVRLGLGAHSDVSGETREPYRVMVNLGVDDIHQEHDRLVSKGIEFIREPYHPDPELGVEAVVCCTDPDGLIIELIEYKPGILGSKIVLT